MLYSISRKCCCIRNNLLTNIACIDSKQSKYYNYQHHYRHRIRNFSSSNNSLDVVEKLKIPSIAEAAFLFRNSTSDVKPSSLMEKCLLQVEKTNHVGINCYTTLLGNQSLRLAYEADDRFQDGKDIGLLDGIPIAIKDNFVTEGIRTTASSRMLDDFIPPFNATPVERLINSGSILMGKTNMDEFGMGSANFYSPYGPTENPWPYFSSTVQDRNENENEKSKRLVPGGSSGGSAAAVAAGTCLAALGSDTGGSVRQPAAFCGIVGLKPSYGRVSRHGLIAYASSLDTPGILARSVTDCAIILDSIAGPDTRDSTCSSKPSDEYYKRLPDFSIDKSIVPGCLEGLRIGIPKEFYVEELNDDILLAWARGCEMLKDAGAEIVEVSIPSVKLALPAYYVIASAEASSNLARYDGLRYGSREVLDSEASLDAIDQEILHQLYTLTRTRNFGEEVQRRILTGSFVLSAEAYSQYYEKALILRKQIQNEFQNVFQQVDALLTPTTPEEPFPIDTPIDPAALLTNDVMTIPVNLAGIPAISVPVGISNSKYTKCKIPVGLQVIGNRFDENMVLKTAYSLEERADFSLPNL